MSGLSVAAACTWGMGCHRALALGSSHYLHFVSVVQTGGCCMVRLERDFSVSQNCLKIAVYRRPSSWDLECLVQQELQSKIKMCLQV